MEQPLDPQRPAAWRSFLEARRGMVDRMSESRLVHQEQDDRPRAAAR